MMKHGVAQEFALPLSPATYDVGPDGKMRLSAILRYQQEAGEQHLAPAGLGWQALAKEHGMAFVASRWRCRVHRLPRLGENLTLRTWHRERRGPRFFRCYRWEAAGEVLLEGVMQFALVSVPEHALLRGETFDRFGLENRPERGVGCPDPERFTLPELTAAGQYRVGRSDIDMSEHLNNTRYADLLWDVLPDDAVARPLTEVQLYFPGECRLGDELRLAVATAGEDAFVGMDNPRGRAFVAKLTWGATHGI